MIWDGRGPYPWYVSDENPVNTGAQPSGVINLLPWWYFMPWHYPDRGWFTDAYPVLSPYYPLLTPDPDWMDAWTMQPYHGMW